MARSFADLEARLRGVESRSERAEEDITSIITTVVETSEDVQALKSDVTELKVQVTTLDSKVTTLDSKVTALDSKVTALDEKADYLSNGMRLLLERQGLAEPE